METMRLYNILIVLLLILGVLATGVVAYFYQQIQQQNNQISSLNDQITNLNGGISNLQTPVLTGSFQMYSTGCYYCSVSGAYANFGTTTAHSASIVFTFYSGSDKTGQVVCTVTYVIGELPGRTVRVLPSTYCSGNAQANSVASLFQWS